MAFCKHIYVIVWLYLCMTAAGSGYYISSTNETWQTAGAYCDLVQPKYQYNGSGVLELADNIQIDEAIPAPGVWIGYFKAFTEFEFKGCGMGEFVNKTYTVYSLVQCHHICGRTHIGLIDSTQIKCMCIDTLTTYLINPTCTSCGDIICGSGERKAVYSVLPDTTSEKGQDAIDHVCKVSTSDPNESAWVNCSDTNTSNTRDVWCSKNEGGLPFVSAKRFSAWNTANDYCADNRSFPASAVGYNGRAFTNLTFTNIRREWTLQPGNGSSSKGPKMFAYIKPGSKEILFSNEATGETKKILCYGPKPTTKAPSPSATTKTSTASPTTFYHSTSTSTTKSQTTQAAGTTASPSVTTTPPKQHTTLSLVSPMTEATSNSGQSDASSKKSSQESSTIGIVSGVTVVVALGAALVIVIVLRNKGKLCFAITQGSKLENTDDNHHISLDKVESNTNENTRGCTKDIEEYYADIDNDSANTESKQTGFYETPGAPLINHIYGTRMKRGRGASKDTDVTYQNTNGKLPKSDSNTFFVLEKHGVQRQRNAANPIPTNIHDYFVLEKQQSAVGNENSVSNTEGHTYFVLEKQSGQRVYEEPSVEAHPDFILEEQTAGNSASFNSANELVMGNGDMYQEIGANYEYAGIDDLRGDNNDYDYTNKAFRGSKTDFSENVYNHLNSGGDEYDHVLRGQNIVIAVENDYADTSGVVRK